MIEINLLPREYRKRKFQITLEKNTLYVIGAGVAVLILLAAYSMFFQVIPGNDLDKKIMAAREEAAKFDAEIKLVNELTEKKNLMIARMGTIKVLDRDRDAWIKVISDLGGRIPDYLWLTDFEYAVQGESEQTNVPSMATIKGKSFSINSLATFLIRLKKSPHLNNIDLVSIKLVEEQGGTDVGAYEAYNFTINCDLLLSGTKNAQTEKILASGKLAAGSEF